MNINIRNCISQYEVDKDAISSSSSGLRLFTNEKTRIFELMPEIPRLCSIFGQNTFKSTDLIGQSGTRLFTIEKMPEMCFMRAVPRDFEV